MCYFTQKGEFFMILACHHISKAFGTDVILDDISFHIEEYEKAAIVGINGAGKSTLLKIIMEELSADSGEVIISKMQARLMKEKIAAAKKEMEMLLLLLIVMNLR